ncbi:hypothetical protein ACC848_38935, partial [Rhizobium johnstonii]
MTVWVSRLRDALGCKSMLDGQARRKAGRLEVQSTLSRWDCKSLVGAGEQPSRESSRRAEWQR